ncbi:glycosyltransferase [Sulfitobacter sp. F26204]|uniref:glycosyltransferase n=1 Tax=Sulfitobacter sp. F26204 TaxID=2996014 RepID=UPI00225DFAF9|nr:glycosyltransferase [Sulfitobacter sp. F26204]MCX7558197.1 glycosyltransferase [Sulfitobacter sp. F26204]
MTPQNDFTDQMPKVTILMGVHNGERHLRAQLDSIAGQTHRHWRLVCSDDESTDRSLVILRRFQQEWPDFVTILKGPKTGFSDNYMSLIRQLRPDAGFVCFADQDDIWLPNKISRSLQSLCRFGAMPALYCGRQYLWYPDVNRRIMSPRMTRPFTIQNALVENIATGNTIMLNPRAAALAQRATCRVGQVFAHDWWLYLLITATGGKICFDNSAPAILYRQHAENAIGAGRGAISQIKRKYGVLQGLFAQRVEGNLQALNDIADLVTPAAGDICRQFAKARRHTGIARLRALRGISPYRQHRAGSLGFWGAASLGRI